MLSPCLELYILIRYPHTIGIFLLISISFFYSSESGLRNLSALLQLGNSVEVRNYVSLLSGILNRLSLDAKANTQAQRHTRNALIRTMCELESREQVHRTGLKKKYHLFRYLSRSIPVSQSRRFQQTCPPSYSILKTCHSILGING